MLRWPTFRKDILEILHTCWLDATCHSTVDGSQRELRVALQQILRRSGDAPVNIVLDAIDNCTDQEEILRFLQDVILSPASNVRVYYTCRQSIQILNSRYAYIAIEDFNSQDIGTYIRTRLPVTGVINQNERDFLQEILKEQSSNIFLWVVVAVNLLQEYLSKGRDLPFLQEALNELPKELSSLYRNIVVRSVELNSPDDLKTMLRVLQWVMFLARPFTAEEWHHVFAFIDNPLLRSIAD